MTNRDWEYIESRLLAPCIPASEAHARLRHHTMSADLVEQANRLMYGMQQFTDLTRDVRNKVSEILRESQRGQTV